VAATREVFVIQLDIQKMLHEAASPACTPKRRSEIREVLRRSVGSDTSTTGLARMVTHLFDSTLANRPDLLPSLFPFFAAACGGRSGNESLAPIEWSLLHEELELAAQEEGERGYSRDYPY
jgi:hypothetical protein